jgi:hypothetical protein
MFRLSVSISKECKRKKSIAQYFALNGNPPLVPSVFDRQAS